MKSNDVFPNLAPWELGKMGNLGKDVCKQSMLDKAFRRLRNIRSSQGATLAKDFPKLPKFPSSQGGSFGKTIYRFVGLSATKGDKVSDNEETKGYMTVREILEWQDSRPVKEQLEENYRRAYRDGWVQAIGAMWDLMFERRLSRQAAFDACYDVWQNELLEWEHGDCSRMELPPWQEVFERMRDE